MMCYKLISILMTFTIVVFASVNSVHSLLNEKVTTFINASSQLVKINNYIKVKNNYNEPISSYSFICDPHWKNNLAHIEAFDEANNTLKINKIHSDYAWPKFEICFHKTLSANETTYFNVVSVVINFLQSLPKSVMQNERHLVLLHVNIYFYTQYLTKVQNLYIYLGTTKIESANGAKYQSISASQALQFGPYSDVLPLSEQVSIIHYENISPFLTVEKLNRFVQISHWGFITICEKISLQHTGPKFKGPFKRVQHPTKDSRIDFFVTTLPGDAFDITLKDEIGLVSSFTVEDYDYDKVEVNVKPRFVLYGGWKIHYEIRYSLPVKNYINYDQSINRFILSIPILDNVFPDMVINEAEVMYIIPEGGHFEDIKVNPYFEFKTNTASGYCYVFDIICRESISFVGYNLTQHHVQNVSLKYVHPQLLMLTKPMTIAMFIFVLYLFFWGFSCFLQSTPEKVFETVTNENRCTQSLIKTQEQRPKSNKYKPIFKKSTKQLPINKQEKNELNKINAN